MSKFCNVPGCYAFGKYCKLHGFTETAVPTRGQKDYQWEKIRDKKLEESPICEVRGCEAPATVVHHKGGRIGDAYIDPADLMSCCHIHHMKIEKNPEWAKQNGYSISRLKQ